MPFHKQNSGRKTPQRGPVLERFGKHNKKLLEHLNKALLDVIGNHRLTEPPQSERYIDKRSSMAPYDMANWPLTLQIQARVS